MDLKSFSRRFLSIRLIEIKRGMSCAKAYQAYRSAETFPTLKPFDDHRCIFIHIPKTGGMAVVNALFGDQLMKGHRGCQFYRCVYGPDYRTYFKFAFVRNPWDRAVSAYKFLLQGGVNARDAAFGRWVAGHHDDFRSFVLGWMNRTSIYSWSHFIPQYEYVCSLRGHIDMDYVGRFETLNDDFEAIRKRLGLSGAELKKINASKRSADYRSFYDDETAAHIARIYQRDISLFGYSF